MEGFTPEQLKQLESIVRTSVREELNDAGLRLDGADHQDEAREDFRFIRRLRKRVDGASSKVGAAVLLALTSGVIWIIIQGVNFWKGQ
jgi:hypothetical protein